MLYRVLMRLATVLVAIAVIGLLIAIPTSPVPMHLHTEIYGLTVVFGPAAAVAALARLDLQASRLRRITCAAASASQESAKTH